ncbi:MAG: hypothetical protein J6C37_01280 [Roseburia sp.]|nr:hypothetical protein [Roseburia sp.]
MNLMEQKKMIDGRIARLEQRMLERYEMAFEVLGKKCFKARENEFFMLTRLAWANAIVIEHAESENEARKNMFEDGDLFYMDELGEENMLEAMLKEIEAA